MIFRASHSGIRVDSGKPLAVAWQAMLIRLHIARYSVTSLVVPPGASPSSCASKGHERLFRAFDFRGQTASFRT